jgi:hypothetical protein
MGVRIEGFDGMMRYLQKGSQKIVDSFLNDLKNLGERAVTDIRERSQEEGFRDSTGNLRSSIGFVVVKDGVIVASGGFERVDGPNRSSTSVDGSQEGRSFANTLAGNYTKGYALIVVAGMDYAAYMQEVEDKDILASGEIFLEKEVKKLVAAYNRKYGK